MDELIEKLLAQIDLDAVLVIQGATALVKFVLNLVARQSYTDYLAPFVAVAMGQLIAWTQYGVGVNAIIYGFKISGGAIVFSELYKRFLEGWSWFKRGKDDPLLKAKVEHTAIKSDARISSIKSLLKKKEP